jgi:methionyl-tRNA formyltransferase
MIVAAYGLLLPEAVLKLPRFGCINVHASLLPRWRGASPIQQAILAGDKETGITLMRRDKGLDTGNALAQMSIPITLTDNSETLHDKLALLGAHLLVEKLSDIMAKSGTTQSESGVTHAPKITKAAALIDWQQPAEVIERQIRAYYPWPIAYSSINGQILRIFQAKIVPLMDNSPPGTLVGFSQDGLVVSTGKGGLLITHAQLPGKKALPMTEILKGHAALFSLHQKLG